MYSLENFVEPLDLVIDLKKEEKLKYQISVVIYQRT